MKKILIVQGGGRANGNTAQLAKAFLKGAQEAGHEVEFVSLNNVQVNGCIGCNACRYGKPCVQKDGFNSLVPKILSADLIVFASPLYFWTISSKLKAFIERFYCIAQPDDNPPLGRYERYPVHDSALLMTAADNFFWTLQSSITSASATRACCWRAAAGTPTGNPRLKRPMRCKGHISLEKQFMRMNKKRRRLYVRLSVL